jgi:hypothetical protein
MNLTLSVDEAVVEKARKVAEAQGTSLNALVREYLESLAGKGRGKEVAREMEKFWKESRGNSGGWKWNREELYEERLNRYPKK